MEASKPIAERALEIARTGRARNLAEVRRALAKEGYSQHEIGGHLSGSAFAKQLTALMVQAGSYRSSLPKRK